MEYVLGTRYCSRFLRLWWRIKQAPPLASRSLHSKRETNSQYTHRKIKQMQVTYFYEGNKELRHRRVCRMKSRERVSEIGYIMMLPFWKACQQYLPEYNLCMHGIQRSHYCIYMSDIFLLKSIRKCILECSS